MERVRHKEANRFKFIPFSERISNVNIDVFHRIPHRFEEESAEKSTYFYLTLQKWTVLNLTQKWKTFRKELGNEIQTLPQLLNNKEKIVDVFLRNIKLQDELSLQPVLELIVALVKDLRFEFYPFYPLILRELIHLLKFKDPDVLEATFTCLAYIFKYLSRELVKDLDKVLLDLAPLLSNNNPDYVRDFAAQSFSFVARKVKDKNKFLSLVLFAVQSSKLSEGCAQLVFEMMKGIKGHTHSCSEELLPVLFDSHGKMNIPQKTLFLLTNQVVQFYCNQISPQYSILFKVLLEVIQNKLNQEDIKGLKKLLRILRTGLNCKEGAHVGETNLPVLVNLLVKLLSVDAEVKKLAAEVCSDMLKLRNLKLPQEFGSRLITKVMQIQEVPILIHFVEETANSAGFEASILPRALQIFSSLNSPEVLQLLTKIAMQKAPAAKNFDEFNIYPLTLTSSTMGLFDFIVETLKNFKTSDVKNILHSVILMRHLKSVDKEVVLPVFKEILEVCSERLKAPAEGKLSDLFLMCCVLETLLYFKKESITLDELNGEQSCAVMLVLKLLQSDKSFLGLKTLDLLLTLPDTFVLSVDLFNQMYGTVQEWLLSPQSNARSVALHCIQKLEESRLNEASGAMVDALQSALEAELTPLTIADYREKIKLLEKLNFEGVGALKEDQHKVLLKYLLGALYCNFKLLWDPISQIIASYSIGMQINSFWDVFFSQLRTAIANCKGMASSQDFSLPEFDEFELKSVKFIKAEDKEVHFNYRNLLWGTMTLFTDLCESKNRDVISVYLPFVMDDILKSSVAHSLTINIRENNSSALNESENLDGSVQVEPKLKEPYAEALKCAVAQLKLLSNFKNPKQCYREPEVRSSYLELLLHRDSDVQKMALECLLSYKFSFMTPYQQNLRNLIDDKKFKDELVHFQIDTNSGIVKDIHRAELMPIVMRILYGKMLFPSAAPRGNKGSTSLLRKSIILRFLSGSSHSEMEIFLQMAFKSIHSYCQEDVFDFKSIIDSIDLSKVPPPKKLQGIINLAEVVVKSFGGLMSAKLQRYIFKVLLSVGSFLCGILAKRDDIYMGYLPSLRNLRTACINSITKFFERFDKFPWREDDINALFHVVIWPNVPKLGVEGIHSPTALLQLFSIWAKNPRYFKLLARYHPENPTLTPLPFILELLLNEKSHPSVITCISSILENLLTLKEEEPMEVDGEEQPPPSLNVDFVLPVDESAFEKLQLKEELNYGSKILFPHVGVILTFLRRKLEESFGKSQLIVLSRITEMATSPEHGDALMTLLIKLLSSKKQKDDDALVNMITTVANLSNIVSNPSSYLRSLSVLFGSIELLQARKILVNLVLNMGTRCPELKEVTEIIRDVNAWDPKHVEQPDFGKRLNAFKTVRTVMDQEDINVDLAFIILHNFFYFFRCETDLSLIDSAAYSAREICPKVGNFLKNNAPVRKQWIETILNLTKNGIASSNENYQNLAISLLGSMARECAELHPVLKDLSVLTNEQDAEVDFFENAQHLQIYRRMKALQKFSNIAKTLRKAPRPRTLIQFILPLASRYICNEKYSGKNSLIDSAIDAVATVCRFLPWQQYQTVLRFYLTKLRTSLEFQKQLTRTVIAILNSFHFDISLSPADLLQKDIKTKADLPKSNDNKDEELEIIILDSSGDRVEEEEKEKSIENLDDSFLRKLEKEAETEEMKREAEKDKEEMIEGENEETETLKEGVEELETEGKKEAEAEGQEEKVKPDAEEKESMQEELVIVDDEKEAETEVGFEREEEGDDEKVEEEEAEKVEEKKEDEEKEKEETTPKEMSEELILAFEDTDAEEEDEPLEVDEGIADEEEKVFAIESITVLNANAALKVEKAISTSLLQQIYKIIGQRSQADESHKLNRKNFGPERDEQDCLKIPLAVTLVKLLQKLPKRMLETQLPGILMRLSTFLKSRADSVRRTTRETLQEIMLSLGPDYLPLLFSEMSTILTRGFQVHVLVYTMHSIIQHVQNLLRPGDMDKNLPLLLEACKSDLFGVLSEEKGIPKLQAQHKETRKTKSFLLIRIMAKWITENCLTNIIIPVKEVLQISYSHKNITKCREYLRQVTLGLSANQFISLDNLYIYVYGTTSESIPQLMPTPPEPPKKKSPKEKPDCFIIPPEPKSRMGVSSNPVKKGSRTNAHIIIEFGFSLLQRLLKKEKQKTSERDVRSYLDPIAPILVNALESQHVKVSTLALQCLSKVIPYDLPSVKTEVKKITNCLFSILHKYAAAGLSKGDNFDLVMATFKAISTLIRETDYHGVTIEQLKILLLYTEQDIYDSTRQATAFILLKTILRKKLDSPELPELMKKVATLSITSQLPHVRLQARQNVLQYMIDYPIKNTLDEFVGFYLSQLNYDLESGRHSSVDMIQSMINTFPVKTLAEQSGLFLMSLGAQLVNDQSSKCKKMVSKVLKAMLTRLESNQRDNLFDIVLVWLRQKKTAHRRMAAQIAGIFVTVEQEEFKKRLPTVIPCIQKQFTGDRGPGQFVVPSKDDPEDNRLKDHHFFQTLQLLLKICSDCPDFLTAEEFQENIHFFTEVAQSLLCHEHEWVRYSSVQFLGYVFSTCQPSDVAAVLNGYPVSSKLSFLQPQSIRRRIRSLILDHCAQFVPGIDMSEQFIDQLIKNLVYFARILKQVETKPAEEEQEDDEENGDEADEQTTKKPPLTLLWLIRRMRRIVNKELARTPNRSTLRLAVVKWIGTVVLCSTKSELKNVLYHLMAPVVREREATDAGPEKNTLKTLASEICGAIKEKVGIDAYSREGIKIKKKLMEKRTQRKNERAQEFVTNPEMAAKRKILKQAKKKQAKKRKLERLKEEKGKKFKKRRMNTD